MFPALQRFFEAAECRMQTELAEFLGIRQSSIADAKKRGTIPSDWLLALWRKKGVNPDWILTGLGARGLRPANKLDDARASILSTSKKNVRRKSVPWKL